MIYTGIGSRTTPDATFHDMFVLAVNPREFAP